MIRKIFEPFIKLNNSLRLKVLFLKGKYKTWKESKGYERSKNKSK